MRRFVDALVLGTIIAMAGIEYLAWRTSIELGLYLLLCYSAVWAAIVIAIRASVRGDLLRQKVREFREQGREYHRFSRKIWLIALLPGILVLLALAVRLLQTLR